MPQDMAGTPPPVWLSRVADLAVHAPSTHELVAGLLRVLRDLTGLESTYLTRIDWDQQVQEVVQSLNTGQLVLEEGLHVPWSDTLCKRAMDEDAPWTSNVSERWGDSNAARELGIETYVSTPVRLYADDTSPWGTLCGAASTGIEGDDSIRTTMRLFADLIGHAIAQSERELEREQRAQAAEARLKARAELTAAAEHAMKSPASAIRGWAEVLLTRWDAFTDTERREGLERVEALADRLLAQLSDLVSESRTDLLAGDLVMRAVDVGELARHVAGRLDSADHPITVTGNVIVTADREALEIVLEHLLDNARAHTPAGTERTIALGVHNGKGRIVVRDDGPGLPPDIDVFRPYVRGNRSNPDGSGLGLHIVRTFVEALRGTVTATSDHGAVFTIDLMLDRA